MLALTFTARGTPWPACSRDCYGRNTPEYGRNCTLRAGPGVLRLPPPPPARLVACEELNKAKHANVVVKAAQFAALSTAFGKS